MPIPQLPMAVQPQIDQIPPPTPFFPPSPYPTFTQLYQHHTSTYPAPLLPPTESRDINLTPRIVQLLLHPTLETALHIWNTDLQSAEFVIRDLRSAPEYEGMMLRAIIARVGGDYDEARGWYRSVEGSEVFQEVWGTRGVERVMALLEGVERLRRDGTGDRRDLERESGKEIDAVVEYCVRKFGTQRRVLPGGGGYDT